MACEYCFYADEIKKREQDSYGFMSEESLKNVIRRTLLKSRSGISYAFQGGEPTLRGLAFFEKALYYEKKYNRNQVPVYNSLQTNGYLIDENWCQFLKENHFLVGLSVDGTKELHDTYRHDKEGKPTFERAEHAADLMSRYGVEYNILTVVHDKVAASIKEIYSFYKRKGWNYQQYIACLEPLQEGHAKTGYGIRPEEYGNFLIELFDLWYRDWKKGRQPYIRQFENYIAMLLGCQPESCEQRGVCGIQNVVEADGSVYPCDFYVLDELRLGNLNEMTLQEIYENRRKSDFLKRSGKLSDSCISCEYYFLCRGGCLRHRDYREAGEYYENYFCQSYRMFFEKCLSRMQEIAVTENKNRGL